MFWTIAAVVLFVGFIITLFPLFRGKSLLQPMALALAFALPATALWIYNEFGTPEGIDVQGIPQPAAASNDPHATQAGEMNTMIEGLRARLQQNPDDLDGLMLLARTLKATQQFEEAAEMLERAHGLAPNNPVVMVELAEAWVFLSPDGNIPDRSVAMLERALDIDPAAQKGLWLMGIAQSQRGDHVFAISYWQTLLESLEPGSDIANTVQQQISEAQALMGMEPDTPVDMEALHEGHDHAVADAEPSDEAMDGTWQGSRLVITAAEGAQEALKAGAVMYVMIRSPGPAMGPPLGVKRLENPVFPLELTVTDQDSMMKERLISTETEVQFQVRISLTGMPTAQSGDWQSESQTVELAKASLVVLNVDTQVE